MHKYTTQHNSTSGTDEPSVTSESSNTYTCCMDKPDQAEHYVVMDEWGTVTPKLWVRWGADLSHLSRNLGDIHRAVSSFSAFVKRWRYDRRCRPATMRSRCRHLRHLWNRDQPKPWCKKPWAKKRPAMS